MKSKTTTGSTEILMREFDANVTLGGKTYLVFGVYEHGEGFVDVEVEEINSGPCIDAGTELYDAILEEVVDWITSPQVDVY